VALTNAVKALFGSGGHMKNSMNLSLGNKGKSKVGPQMHVWSASYYVLHEAITLNPVLLKRVMNRCEIENVYYSFIK
jgi:hypothetical protein